jgi:hypothetical protein
MTNPDFIKLSESMGAKALRCTNLEELPAMMKEFLEYDNTRPILMECLVSSEHVYPMVAAGKALHEQIVSFLKFEMINELMIASPISARKDRVDQSLVVLWYYDVFTIFASHFMWKTRCTVCLAQR